MTDIIEKGKPTAWDNLMAIGDRAHVNIAAGPDYHWQRRILEPRQWEDLRLEMQRRLRRSTGEPFAIVSFEMNPLSAALNEEKKG